MKNKFKKGNKLRLGLAPWNKGLKNPNPWRHTPASRKKLSISLRKAYKEKRHPMAERMIGNKFRLGLTPWIKGKEIFFGKDNPSWKGGKTIDKRGYVLIKNRKHPFCSSTGYIRKHRLVIEKIIGRYLKPNEKCHHLGKKHDNRPKMLMVFINHSAHKRFEQGGIVNPMEIIFDGRKYTVKT